MSADSFLCATWPSVAVGGAALPTTSLTILCSCPHYIYNSFHAIDYKERFVILGNMESTTRADVSSDPYLNYTAPAQGRRASEMTRLQNADLEEALKAAVLGAFDDLADGTEDPLHVSVWSTEPDPLFVDLFPDPEPSMGATEEFGTTHRHAVRVVACICVLAHLPSDLFIISYVHDFHIHTHTQVAIITTSKANADVIIAALQAAPLPADEMLAEGTGPGRPTEGGARRRRGQVEYMPDEEEAVEGGEVAPGVVASYEAGTAQWGGSQKPDVEARAQAAQAEVTKGVKTQMREKKVRCLWLF